MNTTGSSSVVFKNLTKIFEDQHFKRQITAVDDFNLEIKRGELVTLLGPSGCGKTTVLRMMAGFETATSGDILVDGKSIVHLPANKRNSTMVFQSYALFPHMNVEENIRYGLKLRRLPKAEADKKFDRILNVVGLKGFEKRRPNEMSGGQQQRVALARALVVEPGLLLFDEPLSNLDAKLRESMRSEIRRVQQQLSITAIYVTHDQIEAMAISDRVIVMNQGKIEQIGSPQEIYLHPNTRFVAEFMGAANFLHGTVAKVNAAHLELEIQQHRYSIPTQQPAADGSAVTVVIRPEGVSIQRASANASQGKVIERTYLGNSYELRVALKTGETILARQEAKGGTMLGLGDEVELTLRPESIHYLV